ncbi:hypothetical protein AC578_10440 [Pseudocercospora eumusae]|uniref:Uncharacterized protein n=1 Tax=Pseudocercospora eumusae TaxID=321146 RepID=A0A139H2I6_9PEZI|nr:hypothetical protein AC578_10440 [Pseudocercospora eumusae]
MAKPKFVFVNKTAKSSSLSRSDGYEKSRLFSHAQTRPVRKEGTLVITTIGNHDSCAADGETGRRKSLGEVHDLAQSDFDPFQSFCVVLDKGMQNMLSYCKSFQE